MSVEDLNIEYGYFLDYLDRTLKILHEMIASVEKELHGEVGFAEEISQRAKMLEGNLFYLIHYESQLRDFISQVNTIVFRENAYKVKDNLIDFPYIYDEVIYVYEGESLKESLKKYLKKIRNSNK